MSLQVRIKSALEAGKLPVTQENMNEKAAVSENLKLLLKEAESSSDTVDPTIIVKAEELVLNIGFAVSST